MCIRVICSARVDSPECIYMLFPGYHNFLLLLFVCLTMHLGSTWNKIYCQFWYDIKMKINIYFKLIYGFEFVVCVHTQIYKLSCMNFWPNVFEWIAKFLCLHILYQVCNHFISWNKLMPFLECWKHKIHRSKLNECAKKKFQLFEKSELCWKDFSNNKMPKIQVFLHYLFLCVFLVRIVKCFRHVQNLPKAYSNILHWILADGDMYKCCITCIFGSISTILGCQNFFYTFASLPNTICATSNSNNNFHCLNVMRWFCMYPQFLSLVNA